MTWKKIICVLFATLIVAMSPTAIPQPTASKTPNTPIIGALQEENKEVTYPLIFVVKKTDKKNVSIGEWFDVIITVKNIGNGTAYNLTIIDENYPEWTIKTQNHSRIYHVDSIEPNVSIAIKFQACIISSSQSIFSLGRTLVRYQDSKGAIFTAISEETLIAVKKPAQNIDTKQASQILLIGGLTVILPMILVLVLGDYKVYREYLKSIKKR